MSIVILSHSVAAAPAPPTPPAPVVVADCVTPTFSVDSAVTATFTDECE